MEYFKADVIFCSGVSHSYLKNYGSIPWRVAVLLYAAIFLLGSPVMLRSERSISELL